MTRIAPRRSGQADALEVIVSFYRDGLTGPELADELHISRTAAQRRVDRLRARGAVFSCGMVAVDNPESVVAAATRGGYFWRVLCYTVRHNRDGIAPSRRDAAEALGLTMSQIQHAVRTLRGDGALYHGHSLVPTPLGLRVYDDCDLLSESLLLDLDAPDPAREVAPAQVPASGWSRGGDRSRGAA